MSKEEWEAEQAATDAMDPGEPEPPVVAADDGEVVEDEEGPEPHLIIDDETGKHYIAFEIEPPSEEETPSEGGEEK